MDNVIDVRDVNKSFGKKIILNQITFSVPKGQIIGLLGENGAGKTTLINIMLGLIKVNSGSISILDKRNTSAKAFMGVMMQKDIALKRIKVKEIIQLSQSYYQQHLSYQEIITLAQLSDQENLFLKQLSGGQMRRLSFALAMVGNPQILFLDEPTNGMDPSSRKRFWEEILKLKMSGKTIFVTSHHLDELENVADRFLILRDHQIIFDGDLMQLRHNTGNAQIDFDSEIDPTIITKLVGADPIRHLGNHFMIVTNDTNRILSALNPLLADINNIKISQNSLESIFIDLNQRRK
ncbi:ABC transporter ATP-binding protein [Companilactobacillus sp. FL22-1]|uniref:ABC transporter ATP-binding protein n=1 Tax=Companilactobacillus sp. FL22-1 TaxID=3373892 RepID=UPI003754D085